MRFFFIDIWSKLLDNIGGEELQNGRTLWLSSGYAKRRLIKQKKNIKKCIRVWEKLSLNVNIGENIVFLSKLVVKLGSMMFPRISFPRKSLPRNSFPRIHFPQTYFPEFHFPENRFPENHFPEFPSPNSFPRIRSPELIIHAGAITN